MIESIVDGRELIATDLDREGRLISPLATLFPRGMFTNWRNLKTPRGPKAVLKMEVLPPFLGVKLKITAIQNDVAAYISTVSPTIIKAINGNIFVKKLTFQGCISISNELVYR